MKNEEYMANYEKENLRQIRLKINRKTEPEMLEWIEKQDNIQGYIKGLIMNDMKTEGKKMASKRYYIGSMVSDTAIGEMIANMQETADQEEFDRLSSSYRQYMISELNALDDRLWWQPETGEIFWEDDGSGKDLPEADDFETWWKETSADWNC